MEIQSNISTSYMWCTGTSASQASRCKLSADRDLSTTYNAGVRNPQVDTRASLSQQQVFNIRSKIGPEWLQQNGIRLKINSMKDIIGRLVECYLVQANYLSA